ncbi:MAG: gamma-glutamyl-gamma-aminobutyrate hydrolase family protein [Cocleimonas sp.]
MSLRIGLLQCDHVADELIDSHGDYQDMFSDLLHAQDQDIEVAIYDLTANNFPIDLRACDGYIITGSQFSAYDDIPWIHKAKLLVTDLYQANIPTIGICFGHQLIAESLGGKVEKAIDKGWGVGVQGWGIKNPSEWMGEDAPANFSLRASHQDQVVKMPDDSKLYASSGFCPIAGFQTGKHFLTMQGHPEYSKEYTNALIEKRVDRIGKGVVEVAQKSLENDVDNSSVGAWMVAFINQAKLSG